VALPEPGAGQPDGFRHGLDGLLLAHHPLVQLLLELEEPLPLLLRQLVDRDAREGADDLGDVLGPHLGRLGGSDPLPALLLLLERLLLLFEFLLELLGPVELLAGGRVVDLALEALNFFFKLLELGGPGRRQDADPRRGLVDEIDGLVGQVAPPDVLIRELGR